MAKSRHEVEFPVDASVGLRLTLNGGFEFQRLGILYRFAIVASEYNSVIMDRLIEGARRTLKDRKQVQVIRVPGAFEIPLAAKRAAISKSMTPWLRLVALCEARLLISSTSAAL
jgi:hypothetical protein